MLWRATGGDGAAGGICLVIDFGVGGIAGGVTHGLSGGDRLVVILIGLAAGAQQTGQQQHRQYNRQ